MPEPRLAMMPGEKGAAIFPSASMILPTPEQVVLIHNSTVIMAQKITDTGLSIIYEPDDRDPVAE